MKKKFKQSVKSVFVIHRSHSKEAKSKALEIQNFLKQKHISSTVFSQISISEKINQKGDLIISVGGDGTFLKAAHFAQKQKLSVLGIHIGSFGFLSIYNADEALSTIEALLSGKLYTQKYQFICVDVHRLEKPLTDQPASFSLKTPKKSYQALNDIVVERGSLSELISIATYINKDYIYSLKADGMILASPLGSTAYNLAAGGPILHIHTNALALTPVCSHSLTNRPLVIPDDSEILFHILKKEAILTVDGIKKEKLSNQNILILKKSPDYIESFTKDSVNSFTLLRKKLKFGQRN